MSASAVAQANYPPTPQSVTTAPQVGKPPLLRIQNLKKQYIKEDGSLGGGVLGASFEVAEGEVFTLLGPSGCGKTTTLRSIAGLEDPDSGAISLAGQDLYNSQTRRLVPSHQRDMGMVFQSYAIWPHMSVADNAGYALKVSRGTKLSPPAMRDKIEATLKTVGLEAYIDRPATQLSGGQQQRLALARALMREPKLLLLDEPLSNLDAQLREQMRNELQRLQKDWGITSIYVTHDQSEALALSDRIAVMNEGRIVQLGTPKEIYDRPTSAFVASFIGKTNLIQATVAADAPAGTLAKVVTPLGELVAFFTASVPANKQLAVVVRPENIDILPAAELDATMLNRLFGCIVREVYLGEIVEYIVALDKGEQVTVRTNPGRPLAVGDAVTLQFAPERTVALIEA